MDTRMTYDEAKEQKSFYVVDLGVIDHANFYELVKDIDVAAKIGIKAKKRAGSCNTLAYFVNNVVSIDGSPKWVGSFACDISYWITDRTRQDLSELIGLIINEMWYFDFVDDNGNYVDVTDDVKHRKVDLFMNRLEKWFGCVMEGGRELPRGRWIG